MPLVSLLDLEKSLKLNQLLNNNNNNGSNSANISNNTNTANGLFYSNLSNELLKNLVANNKPLANLTFGNQQSTSTNTSVAAAAAAALLNAGNLALSLNLGNNSNNCNVNNANNQANNVNKQINYSRYKTELCRQFSENGECKYGDKCQFAHGFIDLKDINRHPKYKTELCKTFHSKGFCPYGPRCHFIHEINEKLDNLPCALKNEKPSSSPSTLTSNELTIMNESNANTLKHLKSNGYDKKLDELQSQLASTLFSTDELFEEHLRLQQNIASTEGTQLSPVISTASSSSSTSHRSSSSSLSHLSLSSPKLNDLNKIGFLNQAQQMSLNDTLNEQAAKMLLCNSLATAAAIQQYQQDKDDVFSSFNGLSPETSMPSSPAPIRTRSNTSSTSSTFSSGSSTVSFNWVRQTPLKQQQQSNNMLSNGGNIFDFMPSTIEQLTNNHHNQMTPEKLSLINTVKQRQSAADFLQLNSEKIESNKILSNQQIIW